MNDSLKSFRMGNVVEGPSNMSPRETMLLEMNKKLESKVRKLTKDIPSYPRDVIKMAAEKARSK